MIQYKTIFVVTLLTAALCATVSANFNCIPARNSFNSKTPFQITSGEEVELPWRYTSEGWQIASDWESDKDFIPIPSFELVHPLVWAACVLLASVGAAIWASNEWEVARLINGDTSLEIPNAPEDKFVT